MPAPGGVADTGGVESPAGMPPFEKRALRILNSQNIRILLLPYLALVFIHLLSGMQMEQPFVLADELGYLGNARYIAGTAHMPDMEGTQFYHFGYSLLLVPAFLLLSEPVSTYKAAIIINALLIGSLYFSLYYILTAFLDASKKSAAWIAFACCLYPPFLLFTNFAWSETAFVAFYALAIALFGKYLRSGSSRDALLFGLIAGFLYTIHPRAFPVVVIIVLYLLVLAALKVVSRRQALLSATTIGLVFTLTRVVNGHLKAVGWAGEGEFSALELGAHLVVRSEFLTMIRRAAGQILYLSQATQGLFLLGLMAVGWRIFRGATSRSPRRALADPATGVSVLLMITAVGIFLASVSLKLYRVLGPYGLRAADLIHGRYNEAFAVLFMAFGLMQLWRGKLDGPRNARRVFVVAAAILSLTALVMVEVGNVQEEYAGVPWELNPMNIAGVFPLFDILGGLNLYVVSIVAIASYLVIMVMMRLSDRAAVIVLALIFSACSLYNYHHYLKPVTEANRSRLSFWSESSRLGAIKAVSVDMAYPDPGMVYGSQYLMPNTVFSRFDSSEGEEPGSEVVVSSKTWGQAPGLGAELVLPESGRDFALWVLPGEMQARLSSLSHEDVTFGATPILGVPESGFDRQEWPQGVPARWTRGIATLSVPLDPRNPPEVLEIETIDHNPDGARLRVLANGTELWHEQVPAQPWSRTFSLLDVPMSEVLSIELRIEADTPDESPNESTDPRGLGVLVRGIRLKGLDRGS